MTQVRVLERITIKKGKKYRTLYVHIPSDIADSLRIKKGDVLTLLINTVKIDNEEKLGLIYYKP